MKFVLFLVFLLPFPAWAQLDIIGQWKTIDDETGRITSIVEIVERNNNVYGKIVKFFPAPNEQKDPVCEQCDEEDPRYRKKIIGMEILQGLKNEENEYVEGSILDPKNGKVYRCKIWIEKADLMIRGYLGPFYRTQTWKKVH